MNPEWGSDYKVAAYVAERRILSGCLLLFNRNGDCRAVAVGPQGRGGSRTFFQGGAQEGCQTSKGGAGEKMPLYLVLKGLKIGVEKPPHYLIFYVFIVF